MLDFFYGKPLIPKHSYFILLIFFLHIKLVYLYRLTDTNINNMQPKKSFYSSLLLVFSIAVFLCSFSVYAQTDSLQGKSYEELIKLYNSSLQNDIVRAKTYATSAYEIAKKENNNRKMGLTQYYIGVTNYYQTNYKEALNNTKRSLTIAKKIEDNLLSFRNHNLNGNIYSETKKEIDALNQYLDAQKYADLTNEPINSIVVSVNIALLKKEYLNHQEAIDLLKENLNLLEKVAKNNEKKDFYQRLILTNLADSYLRIQKPKEAEHYNNLAFKICSKTEHTRSYYWALMNDAIIQYQYGNYNKSIEISTEAEKYFLGNNSKDQLVTPYYYIGKSLYELKKYNQSVDFLEKSIKIAQAEKVIFLEQKEAHRFLSLSYSELNDAKNAAIHFKKYSELDKKDDSINISVNNKIHKEHEILPLQKEIDSLGKYTNYLYSASAVLLFSLVGFFIWFKRKQQQNKIRFQELLLTIEKLEQPKEKIVSETVAKESANPVTDENAIQILKALETFEEKELYLRQDCTLGYVAKKVKTNTSYLSNVINTYKEKSFKSYLSELRINSALVKLKNDDKLRSYTIKAIAEEFGFKRSETFSRAFKAQTGMYPSYYIKNLQNQKDT